LKIFISHSSKDNELVKKIVEILDEYDIDYWVDQKELRGEGHSLWSEINDGLETSDHFILVWSKSAKKSENVKKELMSIIGPEHDELIVRIILRTDTARLWRISSDLKNHSDVSEENIENVMNEIINNVLEVDTDLIKDFESSLDDDHDSVELELDFETKNNYLYSRALRLLDKTAYDILFQRWRQSELERRKDSYLEEKNEKDEK